MKRNDTSPQAYREDVTGSLRPLLEKVRDLILEEVPGVEESIRYGMLDYPGIANLAAQKDFVALYVSPPVLDGFRDRFKSCGKSCVRFRPQDPVDEATVRALIRDLRDRSDQEPAR